MNPENDTYTLFWSIRTKIDKQTKIALTIYCKMQVIIASKHNFVVFTKRKPQKGEWRRALRKMAPKPANSSPFRVLATT